jgi:hypothetical protein
VWRRAGIGAGNEALLGELCAEVAGMAISDDVAWIVRARTAASTSFDPTRPVPPITTIFMGRPPFVLCRSPALRSAISTVQHLRL